MNEVKKMITIEFVLQLPSTSQLSPFYLMPR